MAKLCEVMIKNGIADPKSHEATECCLHCPEPVCLLVLGPRRITLYGKMAEAVRLHSYGLTIPEIATKMGKSDRQILRYLMDARRDIT